MSRLEHVPFKKEWFMVVVICIVVVAAIGSAGYFYSQYQHTKNLLGSNNGNASSEQVNELVGKVGALMELPKETPTIATVSDVSKLANQPFFAHAKNGDKVLIFAKAQKAVLYRVDTNKIVEVSAINLDPSQSVAGAQTTTNQTTQSSPSVSPTPAPVKLVIYNGTSTVGLTKRVEKQVVEKLPQVSVIGKENAARADHASTVVVDLTGKNKVVAENLAKIVEGKVATLPKDETKPTDADILIIAGQDYVQ